MKIYDNISQVFGNTPLVKFQRIYKGYGATVAGKLEFYNPTSSVKDRLAIAMVDSMTGSGHDHCAQ